MNRLASRQSPPLNPLVSTFVSPFGLTVISMVFTRHLPLDRQFDRAIGKGLFDDGVAALAGLDACLLDGVLLQEAIELFLVAPGAGIVVVADLAGRQVEHDRIQPARQRTKRPAASLSNNSAVPWTGSGNPSPRHAAATASGSRTSVLI